MGCDIQLYEMAFAMREKRYAYEFQIREEQKEIELLQKELDTDTKYLKIVESILKSHQEELEKFMVFSIFEYIFKDILSYIMYKCILFFIYYSWINKKN